MTDPDLVRQVAAHHRAELLALANEMRADPRFTSGAAWSIRALDRVLRACDGETDPARLGLAPAVEVTVEQDGLFG